MLNMIKLLDAGTMRGLIVATIPLLVLIGSFFGLDQAIFQMKLEAIGQQLVALVSLAGITWAAYARVFKPTPPLTQTAVTATQAYIAKTNQQGFARLGMLCTLLSLALLVLGCTGTREAYTAAKTVDQQAYVVVEQYESLLAAAADIKEKPGTPYTVIQAMQEADVAAAPVVDHVKQLRDAYMKVHDAKTQEELQDAVDQAILLVTDLARTVNKARSGT